MWLNATGRQFELYSMGNEKSLEIPKWGNDPAFRQSIDFNDPAPTISSVLLTSNPYNMAIGGHNPQVRGLKPGWSNIGLTVM